MKPIEFEEKYKPYEYREHPRFLGKEIKKDVMEMMRDSYSSEYTYKDKETGLSVTKTDASRFTKESIEKFEQKFILGFFKGYHAISDDQLYYLEFVGAFEHVLVAKKINI